MPFLPFPYWMVCLAWQEEKTAIFKVTPSCSLSFDELWPAEEHLVELLGFDEQSAHACFHFSAPASPSGALAVRLGLLWQAGTVRAQKGLGLQDAGSDVAGFSTR
jgi:hypothetical protein